MSSLLPAGSCPLLIRSWLEELIHSRSREKQVMETDAPFYSMDGLAARKPNLLFYGARICSNFQRLGTSLCSGEKKARERRVFLLFLFVAEKRKFPSASSLASFIRQTEQYRRKEERKTRDCQLY